MKKDKPYVTRDGGIKKIYFKERFLIWQKV